MEKNGFIDFFLRERPDFYDTFSNDAEIAFMTQDKLMNVGSWANSRAQLIFLKSTSGSSYFNADDDIVYISIAILLHAWSASTHPSS